MLDYTDDSPVSSKARPFIMQHREGPMLVFSDDQLHWLTTWERILFWFGLTDADRLQSKRRPNLMRVYRGG
jgi:hypothetical protein